MSLQVGYPASFTVCCREFSYTAYTEHAVERAEAPIGGREEFTQLAKTGGTIFPERSGNIYGSGCISSDAAAE